ncbi:MAG: hypothetical protein SWI22_15555 [Pseudomonadota bacterium]|nr:hypothetical protein [Pseudomonadota bacterium]
MSNTPAPPIDRDDLLKKIESKLTWIVIFLFIIMLNTCSLNDDIEDAIRDRGPSPTPAAPAQPAPAAQEG